MTASTRNWVLILSGLLGFFVLGPIMDLALAADGQGAYTAKNAQSEGYVANRETASYFTLTGADTLTGLEDPVGKFTSARIFRLHDPASRSEGTKVNLKLQLKFSTGGANATVWVVYYYVDPAAPTVFHLTALDQPLGGTITATAAQDGALFLAPVEIMDTFGATHCVVFSTAISAGNADLWLGSY